MAVEPRGGAVVLGSDRRHVNQHPLDELHAIFLPEDSDLDHLVDVVDRQAMDGRGDRDHVKSVPPRVGEFTRFADRKGGRLSRHAAVVQEAFGPEAVAIGVVACRHASNHR